jgi:hypothetical protein
LDSGTNVLLLPDEAFQPLKQLFVNNCTANPLKGVCSGDDKTLFDGYCFQLTQQDIDAFPTLQLQLDVTN